MWQIYKKILLCWILLIKCYILYNEIKSIITIYQMIYIIVMNFFYNKFFFIYNKKYFICIIQYNKIFQLIPNFSIILINFFIIKA
jgi:hypothetical protein